MLLAHGGGQTRHAWSKVQARLAQEGWQVCAVDLRGHGASAWPDSGDYSLEAFGRDLRTVAGSLPGTPALVGASLGGLAGLAVEILVAPRTFSSLTLVDVVTRMEPAGIARIRTFMLENLESGFGSLEEAAGAVARYLPQRKVPDSLDGLSKNLRLDPDGRYRWHWDPRFMRRDAGASDGAEKVASALDARLEELRVPVHLIRGRMSDVVSAAAAEAFRVATPNCIVTDVAGAGHMVSGDRNDAFSDAILSFLAGNRDPAGAGTGQESPPAE